MFQRVAELIKAPCSGYISRRRSAHGGQSDLVKDSMRTPPLQALEWKAAESNTVPVPKVSAHRLGLLVLSFLLNRHWAC